MNKPKLEPCPHCGGNATGWHRDEDGAAFVKCDDCNAKSGYFTSEESARAAWNRRAPLPDNKVVEMVFGRGELGVATVAANEDAPLREVLIYRLPSPVLPISSSLGDDGKSVEDLENVLVRMHFENAESAHVLDRAVHVVLDSFGELDNKALTCDGCECEEGQSPSRCRRCMRYGDRTDNYRRPPEKGE